MSTGNITAPVDVFGISRVFISVKSGKLELLLDSDVYSKPLDADDLTIEFKDNAYTFTSNSEKDANSSNADGNEETAASVNGMLQMQEDNMVKMTINTGGSDMIFYMEKSDAAAMKAAKKAAEEEAEAADEEEAEIETEAKKDTEKETKEETKKSEK